MANENLIFANQENNQSAEIKKTPNIRTMGSDVSEYAKSKNLSQVAIAAEELKRSSAISEMPEEKPSSRRATNIIAIILGSLAVIAVIAAGGIYFYYNILPKPKPGGTQPEITIYFSSEKLETLALEPKDILALKLIASSQNTEPNNAIKRIGILVADEKGIQSPANAKNFFRLLHISAPALIAGNTTDIMPFFYYQDGVARLGFLEPVRDENLTLQTMLSWEASIQKDLSPLFLQELPETASALFEDKIFKNINYRFMKLSQTKDFGIGYFLFPAKHYLVVTTSENSLQSVITRLFETK